MARTGRPTKLTAELRDKIVALIQAGNYIETASAACGISKETLYKWLRAGARSKGGPKRDFVDAVQKAVADSEVRDVLTIGLAAKTQWQAAAWRLERKNHDRWGRKDKVESSVELTGAKKGPVRVALASLSDADLDALERAATALGAVGSGPGRNSRAETDSGGEGEEGEGPPR